MDKVKVAVISIKAILLYIMTMSLEFKFYFSVLKFWSFIYLFITASVSIIVLKLVKIFQLSLEKRTIFLMFKSCVLMTDLNPPSELLESISWMVLSSLQVQMPVHFLRLSWRAPL